MTIAEDTDGLLSVWGETVSVVRNALTYSDTGAPATETWSSIASCSADFQPASGQMVTLEGGQQRTLTHRVFFPALTAIKQGDRIRPSGWASGDDEYLVVIVLAEEGHVEVGTVLVAGHG